MNRETSDRAISDSNLHEVLEHLFTERAQAESPRFLASNFNSMLCRVTKTLPTGFAQVVHKPAVDRR
jgi:hypothetical protein